MITNRICEIDYRKLTSLDELISTENWQNDIPERKFTRFLRTFFDEVTSRCRYISYMKTKYHLTNECLKKIEFFPGQNKTKGYILPDISENITKLNNLFDAAVVRINNYKDAKRLLSLIIGQFWQSINYTLSTGHVRMWYAVVYDYINQIEDMVEYGGGYDDPGDELYLRMKDALIRSLDAYPLTLDGANSLLSDIFRYSVACNDFTHHLINIYDLDNNMGALIETDLGVTSIPILDFAMRDIEHKLTDIAAALNPDCKGLSCTFASKFLRFINSNVYTSSLLSACDNDEFENYNKWEEKAVQLIHEVLSFIENPSEHDSDTKLNEDTSDSEIEKCDKPETRRKTPTRLLYTSYEVNKDDLNDIRDALFDRISTLFTPSETGDDESLYPDDVFKSIRENGDDVHFLIFVGDGGESDVKLSFICPHDGDSLLREALFMVTGGCESNGFIGEAISNYKAGGHKVTHVAFGITDHPTKKLMNQLSAAHDDILDLSQLADDVDNESQESSDTKSHESEGVVIYASRPVRTGATPLMVCHTMIELILSLFDPGEDAPESDHPDDLFKESIKNGDKIYFALAIGDGGEHDAVFKCSCNPNEKSLMELILSEIYNRGLHKDISRTALLQMDGNPSTTHVAFAMTNISSDYLAKNMRARDVDIDKFFNDNFKDKGKDGKLVIKEK